MKNFLRATIISALAYSSLSYSATNQSIYGNSGQLGADPGVAITNDSGSNSVIQYTEIRFYLAGCTTQLGTYPISGGERTFNNGETIHINNSSMYQIAVASGAPTPNIGCAKISICSESAGTGNCNSRGTVCPNFTLSCSDSTCTSSNTISVTNYGTTGGDKCTL